MRKNNSGFSLVELSIVVVIIGVIIGAITYIQSIREKAESRAIIAEMGEYKNAISAFRDKYKYRPGDHPDAGRYFTSDDNADTDGDGDGRWDTATERDVMWPQLYQAGFISQKLSGTGAASEPGVNRPESRVGGGWTIIDTLDIDPPGAVTSIKYHFVLRYGQPDGTEDLGNPSLNIEKHRYIDAKIDAPDTPLSGFYVVGEPACVSESGGVYSYQLDEELLCTANMPEISAGGTYSP